MYKPPRQPEGGIIGANVAWYEAMDRPGAFQMGFVRRLFESVPFTRLVPDQRRYGVAYLIDTPDAWGIQTYTPPSSGPGNDWVLLIEDAAAGFPVPGARQ